tara:strand:+ start:691 stop:1545 length:855 start_codon:yes stop_codon:yes gene_type:complete
MALHLLCDQFVTQCRIESCQNTFKKQYFYLFQNSLILTDNCIKLTLYINFKEKMSQGILIKVREAAELLFGDQKEASTRKVYRLIDKSPDIVVRMGKSVYLNRQEIENIGRRNSKNLFNNIEKIYIDDDQREKQKKEKRGLKNFFEEMRSKIPKGYSKKELASKLGKAPGTLSRWISGSQRFTDKNAKDIINFYQPYSQNWTWDLLFLEEETSIKAAEKSPIITKRDYTENNQIEEEDGEYYVAEKDEKLDYHVKEIKKIFAKKYNCNSKDCQVNVEVNKVLTL